MQVGQKVKDLSGIAQKPVMRICLIQEWNECLVAVHGTIVDAILRNGAVPDIQHKILAIVGDKGVKLQFGAIRPFVYQSVVGLRRAECVPVQAIHRLVCRGWPAPGCGIATVKKSGVVVRPGQASEFAPLQDLGIIFCRIDLTHPNLLPVTAVAREPVGHQRSIATIGLIDQGDCAVFAEMIRIENLDWLTVEPLLHIENVLILQPVVDGKEVSGPGFDGHGEARIIP